MDIQDLQKQWKNQNSKQDNQNDLIVRLFNESLQNKVSYNLKKITIYSILFMIFNLAVIIYSWIILVNNITSIGIVISAITMLILSKIVFYKNVWQLEKISKINYAEPIIKVQETIEKLKMQRIKHNRFIFIFSIVYFWLFIFLLFGWDVLTIISSVWENAPIVLLIHGSIFIAWFPIALWLLKKYDMPDEASSFWTKMKKDSFLTDQSVNFSLNNITSYLHELEEFQKAE